MKKLNLLAVLLCVCPMMMFGQLEVKPDGKIVVGIVTGAEAAQLTIFRYNNSSPANGGMIGLTSYVNSNPSSNSTQTVIAVEALSSAIDSGSNIVVGVKSTLGNKTSNSGKNYGVLGGLGTDGQKGAGILGIANPLAGSPYISLSDFYAGYFRGKVNITDLLTVAGTTYNSDFRYKQNITELNNQKAFNNLYNLTPVEYNFKQRYLEATDSLGKAVEVGYFDEKSQIYQKKHYGLIAQEVQKLYPDLVYEDGDGYLSIDYVGIIPLLIQSVKELKAEIDDLKAADKPKFAKAQQNEQDAALYQNTPNPFSQSTEIRYYLPVSVNAAALCIYDLYGKQLKQIHITERGEGSQVISGSEFSAGMYLYALIADGKEIDVKRMILTE